MSIKENINKMIAYPIHFSAFVSLYGLLIFLPLIRPPILLTLILVTALVWLSMHFGRVLADNRPKNPTRSASPQESP